MEKYNLKVGSHAFKMHSDEVAALDLVNQNEVYHLLSDNKSYKIKVVKTEGKTITLSVNNNLHVIAIEDSVDMLVDQMGLNKVNEVILKDIKAPMPGLILEINVTAGQEIKAGDPILILEAMKMENVIKAAGDGIVKEILLQKGATVEKNQVIIEMV